MTTTYAIGLISWALVVVTAIWFSVGRSDPKVCYWRPAGEPRGAVKRKHRMNFQFMTEDAKWSTYRCRRCGHEEIIETPKINVHDFAKELGE